MVVRISKNRVALENIPLNESIGGNIASAGTINLTTTTGNTVHITGTTAITAVTLGAGMIRDVIFDGALTLTHHATNNHLPGGANITTAVNDRARYISDGTTVYCVNYQKADGAPITGAVAAGAVLQVQSTTKTDIFTTTSTAFVDVTGLSRAITPAATANKVLVIAQITGASSAGVNGMYIKLVRDSTDILLGDTAGSRIRASANLYTSQDSNPEAVTLSYLDSPASVVSLTYKIQIACSTAGTSYINQSKTDADGSNHARTTCTITCMEIKG